MPQLVAVSPDILFGQFFCECHRHNAEMTPALHFAQRLSGRSWDAILSNAFVNYVYNVLTLQYPTISRQVGLRTTLHVPPETLKFECNFLVKQDLSGRICNVISSNVFVNDTYNDLTLQDQPISRQTGLAQNNIAGACRTGRSTKIRMQHYSHRTLALSGYVCDAI